MAHQHLHELLLADLPIVVFVNLLEDLPNFILAIVLFLQEGSDLIVSDSARVVDVKVGEGLFEVGLAEHSWLQPRHYKLGKVDFSGAISVDHPHQELHPLWGNFHVLQKSLLKLLSTDHPVVVLVELLEELLESALFFGG